MANTIDYNFNIGGNYTAAINSMSNATGDFSAKVDKAQGSFGKLITTLISANVVTNALAGLKQATDSLNVSGIALDSNMHDLSAVAGVVGDDLKQIEQYARQSAKAFGTDAATAVEGYKLLLSQLSPELGKYPEALQAMGNCIQTTSKLMGGDGVAAAEVLTTAMNQYGVSLADPMKASQEMARMMNVMAAAGQAGSAELPAIKVALQQCGMAAKAANVSFEETNAAIQVLDKAGKKGSEGGVALRNVMTTLAAGRFLPEKTQEELVKAGINVADLSDKTQPLKTRLEALKPLLNDDALLSALFGRENANAARALIQGTDSLQAFTDAVTGTASAEEQAAIIMESYSERQARINQQIEDAKISFFQATDGLSLWAGAITDALAPLGQLFPLLQGAWAGMKAIVSLDWPGMFSTIRTRVISATVGLVMYNDTLAAGIVVSGGFKANMLQAALAVARFATVGLWNALKGLGALVLSFITGGTASAGFAATASASFATFKLSATTACKAVSTAIKSIPLVGWIIAAVAALVALGTYFWKTSDTFRAVLKGIGAAFVATFKGIWDLAVGVFGGIADLLKAAFKLDGKGIKDAIGKMKGSFVEFGTGIGQAFSTAYNAEMEASKKKKEAEEAAKKQDDPMAALLEGQQQMAAAQAAADPVAGTLGTVGATAAAGNDKIKNITVSVEKLVERFEIHTTNLQGDLSRVKDMVAEALLSALNDVNLVTS